MSMLAGDLKAIEAGAEEARTFSSLMVLRVVQDLDVAEVAIEFIQRRGQGEDGIIPRICAKAL